MTRLRSLLLRWLLFPTLALWAAGFGVSYVRSLAQAHEAYDRTLLGSALVVCENLHIVDTDVVADLPHAALEMLRTDAQDRIFYRIADYRDDRTITGYDDLPGPAQRPTAEPVFYDTTYKDQPVRVVALRQTLLDGAAQRQLLVQVAETLDARHQLTRRIVSEAAVVQLLLIALAAGLIAFGVRKGLAPLKRLRDEVRARSVNDLTPIATGTVPREVAPLIDAINAHTERQRQLGEAQVRFVANASHQLKTPLTLLRAQVGHALLQHDVQSMRAVVERLHEATDATGRLVTQLLALARSEPGRSLETVDIELTELAHQATFELLPAARAKDIDFGFEADAPVQVRGEPLLLRELIVNLAHNAIIYTPAGGRVTVSVGTAPGAVGNSTGDLVAEAVTAGAAAPGPRSRAWLRVVDNGPGIAPAERARVLERFYRVAGSGAQGSGLGLAIAQEICNRHAIELSLHDAPDTPSGLCVHLQWPAPDPDADSR
jgi:two-component system, OmpR family, sensor histidine kinase TctE